MLSFLYSSFLFPILVLWSILHWLVFRNDIYAVLLLNSNVFGRCLYLLSLAAVIPLLLAWLSIDIWILLGNFCYCFALVFIWGEWRVYSVGFLIGSFRNYLNLLLFRILCYSESLVLIYPICKNFILTLFLWGGLWYFILSRVWLFGVLTKSGKNTLIHFYCVRN